MVIIATAVIFVVGLALKVAACVISLNLIYEHYHLPMGPTVYIVFEWSLPSQSREIVQIWRQDRDLHWTDCSCHCVRICVGIMHYRS